jgi:hypothetical protein
MIWLHFLPFASMTSCQGAEMNNLLRIAMTLAATIGARFACCGQSGDEVGGGETSEPTMGAPAQVNTDRIAAATEPEMWLTYGGGLR